MFPTFFPLSTKHFIFSIEGYLYCAGYKLVGYLFENIMTRFVLSKLLLRLLLSFIILSSMMMVVQSFVVVSTSCRASALPNCSTRTSKGFGTPPASASFPTSLGLFRSKSSGFPNVLEVESHADWLELTENLDEDDQQGITAVTFHASWCKYCQKFKLKWNRKVVRPLAGEVKFASVEFGANKKLCQGMNVNKLPTVQFYSHGKLLSSFPCGPKGLPMVQNAMQRYMEMDSHELQQEAEKWAQYSETKMQEDSKSSTPSDIPEAFADDEEEDESKEALDNDEMKKPELYIRKRDRLKTKLSRKRRKAEQTL